MPNKNMPQMEDFFTLSYIMGGDYEKVQQLIEYVHEKMLENKEIDTRELLLNLFDISKSMLDTQRNFTDICADDSIKAQMHYKTDTKEQKLLLLESELKEKGL